MVKMEPSEAAVKASAAVNDKPRPAFVAATSRDTEEDRTTTSSLPRRTIIDGSTGARPVSASMSGSTPAPMRWVTGPSAAATRVAKLETPPARTVVRQAKADPKAAPEKPAAARTGVQIQIGATDDADKAHDLLARARDASKRALAAATPYTEKVQKGRETLWRARFAGLDADKAEAACRDLKRSGFACFTTKN
jgi:D-alanyl-D-alanine carboxypeptidase